MARRDAAERIARTSPNSLGLDKPVGAVVASVAENGPAAEAGLKRGDVITAVDGQEVDDGGGVGFRLGVKPLGGSPRLTVLRAGKTSRTFAAV